MKIIKIKKCSIKIYHMLYQYKSIIVVIIITSILVTEIKTYNIINNHDHHKPSTSTSPKTIPSNNHITYTKNKKNKK